jgi:CRISPR-associated protein Cmr3
MSAGPHRLALVPRDGFFAKDGRGWSTSARTHVLDWPWPTTVRGALTTASGKLIEAAQRGRDPEKGRFDRTDWTAHHRNVKLGRMVALRRSHGGAWSRMWPVPADALWLEECNKVVRLQPSPLPDGTRTLGRAAPSSHGSDPRWGEGYEAAREALWVPQNVGSNAKPLSPPRWWPEAETAAWVCARPVATDPRIEPSKQWPSPQKRLQTHVGIRGDTLTGDDGILYLHDVVETLEPGRECAIGVEAEWPPPAGPNGAAALPSLARLGSDSRIAWVETIPPSLFVLPENVAGAFAAKPGGLRLMLAAPACFARGWVPDGFAPTDIGGHWQFRGELPGISGTLILRAACVPRPMHISGWDMVSDKDKGGAPRSTSRLVQPGAVYFFERAMKDGTFTTDDAEALWLAALGGRTDEGFGRVVPGIWNPKDTER